MATASRPLTLDEFHARYRGQKPHFEYWFGEAIQKAVPNGAAIQLADVWRDLEEQL
jgi:hypothetical protein